MKDLIGMLGLPGAALALVATALLAVLLYRNLRANNKPSGNGNELNRERAVRAVLDAITANRETLRDELAETRHALRDGLATVQSEILLHLQKIEERLLKSIEREGH